MIFGEISYKLSRVIPLKKKGTSTIKALISLLYSRKFLVKSYIGKNLVCFLKFKCPRNHRNKVEIKGSSWLTWKASCLLKKAMVANLTGLQVLANFLAPINFTRIFKDLLIFVVAETTVIKSFEVACKLKTSQVLIT